MDTLNKGHSLSRVAGTGYLSNNTSMTDESWRYYLDMKGEIRVQYVEQYVKKQKKKQDNHQSTFVKQQHRTTKKLPKHLVKMFKFKTD